MVKKLLEIHILQNYAPSNLNRDDTGSPKDAVFGGVRRARISSQCLKRAARTYFRARKLLDEENLALRTKRVARALAEALVQFGRPAEEVERVVEVALGGLKLRIEDGKSQYLLFLGKQEIARIADLIHDDWDVFRAAIQVEREGEKKKAKEAKKTAKDAVPVEMVRAMEDALDGGKAVDVALFGRMLADLPKKNQEAAAQVAHAFSTHKVEREFDFYTAVDDLQPDDTAGADMLGTVEFNSACYYRYAVVDLEKLVENLQGDKDLVIKGIEAFLRASIYAEPTGKQNTFAAHNPPGFIAFTVREDASPRSLANAFERPVQTSREASLTASSVQALAAHWAKLDQVYGQTGRTAYLDLAEVGLKQGEKVEDVEKLISKTMETVRKAMEV